MTQKKKAAKKAAKKYLSAEEIFAVQDLKREIVHVPEWGCDVIVSTMSGQQRDAFELSLPTGGDLKHRMQNIRARIVAACCVNEDGSPLFTLDQVEQLGRKSGSALKRLSTAAERLNKITDQDKEGLGKN